MDDGNAAAQSMADLRMSDAHGAYDEMGMCTDFEQEVSLGQAPESLPLPTEEAGT